MNDPVKNWDAMRNVPLTVKIIGGIGLVLPFLPFVLMFILKVMGKWTSNGFFLESSLGNLTMLSSVVIGVILLPPSIYLLRGYGWALWFFRGIFGLMIFVSFAGISSFGLFSLPFGFIGLFLLQKNKLYFQK